MVREVRELWGSSATASEMRWRNGEMSTAMSEVKRKWVCEL